MQLSHIILMRQALNIQAMDESVLSPTTRARYSAEFARRAHERDMRARVDARRAERAEQWQRHMLLADARLVHAVPQATRDASPPIYTPPQRVSSARHELEVRALVSIGWTVLSDHCHDSGPCRPTGTVLMTACSNYRRVLLI